MWKKAVAIIIIIITLFMFSLPAYATIDDIFNPTLAPTGQFLAKIFRPEFDCSTFSTLMIVSGIAYEEDITVQLATYNESTGMFEALYTNDGENKWEASGAGLFFKEVKLKQGVNKVRIAAYKTLSADELIAGENLQISEFTITVLNEETRKSFYMNIMDLLGRLN